MTPEMKAAINKMLVTRETITLVCTSCGKPWTMYADDYHSRSMHPPCEQRTDDRYVCADGSLVTWRWKCHGHLTTNERYVQIWAEYLRVGVVSAEEAARQFYNNCVEWNALAE